MEIIHFEKNIKRTKHTEYSVNTEYLDEIKKFLLIFQEKFISKLRLWYFGCLYFISFSKHFYAKFKDPPSGLRQFFGNWKPFKIDEKRFLFHLESSFHSQDLKFLSDFLVMLKNGFIQKIRLISKFITSQTG